MAERRRRRSAVDEVLGSSSPVGRKMKAQQDAAARAREEDGVPAGAAVAEEPLRAPVVPTEKPPEAANEAVEAPKKPVRRRVARRSGEERKATAKRPAAGARKKAKPAKRIPVTGNEGDVWEGVCRTLSTCVGAKVTFAAASRAIWAMVVEIEDELEHFEAPELEKPAHADVVANADFEDQLKGFILEVLRSKRS